MKKLFLTAVFLLLCICSQLQAQSSFTDLLAKQFHQAWNAENINEMVNLIQPNAFYKSQHQLWNGSDRMKSTVLKTNPSLYKFTATKELHSRVEDQMAWSIGEFTCDVYENGSKTGKQMKGTYTYIFTKKTNKDWKLQMMIYHEE